MSGSEGHAHTPLAGRLGRASAAALALAAVLVPLAASPVDAAFPGSNGRITFGSTRAGGSFQVHSMAADGSDVQQLTTTGGLLPAWSADASKITFQSTRDGNLEIYVMNADGSGQTRLTNNAVFEEDPSFSPDGTKIAFTSARDDSSGEIYVMNADGTDVTRLTTSSGVDRDPVFSPDGTKIAFSSSRDDNFGEIYVMNADGSSQTRLTTSTTGFDAEPDWSPDGTKLVFAAVQPGVTTSSAIFTMSADGTSRQLLVDTAGGDTGPVYSPDDTKVAFASSAFNDNDVLTVNASDGSGQTNLTNNALIDNYPDWAPGTAQVTHTLSVTKDGTGAGTVSSSPTGIDCGSTCSADFTAGIEVALSATADAGSTFSGWSGACSGAGACDVTMDEARSVTATFTGGSSSASWTVNTTDDANDGSCTTTHCSLREAINRANTESGTDTIGFDISGSGPHTIQPTSQLPTIAEAVVLDGTTEPDFAGAPVVELDGQSAGAIVSGLVITGGGSTVRGLAVNRFGQAGIHLTTGGGNLVAGNYVGTDVSGALDRGNTNVGIHVQSSNNAVGGTSAADRNVVSGSNGPQIAIEGPSVGSTVHGNVVLGNYVGTNAGGTAAVETIPRTGIVIQDAYDNRIGGTAVGEGNLVSGNNTGVRIANSLSHGNLVQGNRIGTAADGTSALGNNTGVDVMFTTQQNTIGGTSAQAANTIAFNIRDGVLVYPTAAGSSILGNSIHSNFEQGIDLNAAGSSQSGDGVTANDAGDTDAGGNGLQNYPLLTSAESGGGQTEIAGSLDTAAGTYRVEFFSNANCDTPGGNGEGRLFLGSEDVAVSGGPAAFTATLPVEVTVGHVVTATATAPGGSTSEFSACTSVTQAAQPADLSIAKADSADPVTAGAELTYTLTVDNAGPGDAEDVVVTDTLPAGVSFVSTSDGGSESGGVVTWNLGTLGASDPALELAVVVDVDAGQTADLSNTAQVSTSSEDSNEANDSDSESTAVEPPPADVSIAKADSADPVTAGAELTYTLTVDNAGPGDAADVQVSDTLPAGVSFVSASDGGVEAGGVVTWNVGTLAAAGPALELALVVDVDAGQTADLSNNAQITTSSPDSNAANDTDAETTAVQAPTAPIPITLDPETATVSGVWAWGTNANGELGNGGTANATLAVKVSVLAGAHAVAAGSAHSLALVDGEVWAWGFGGHGQLGNGTTATRLTPAKVSGLTSADAIAAGAYHGLALLDGEAWAWGNGSTGQLGDGTTATRLTPVKVSGLAGVDAIAAGTAHNLALVDGEVWAWGFGGHGQLGDGTTANRLTPVKVSGLAGVDAIAAGASHGLALVDGEVWTWGINGYGQLGDGTTATRLTPVKVSGLAGVDAIAAGDFHSLALVDGEVSTWGINNYGQLGDGTQGQGNSIPGQAIGLADAVAIDGGGTQSLALGDDGTVWQWGWGGGSGDGCWCVKALPHRVIDITNAGAVAAGSYHNLAAGTGRPTHSVAGSAVAPPGGTVTSDFGGDGATADYPVEVAVTTPNGGTVSLVTLSSSSSSDYSVGGRTLQIEAPDATAENPLVLTFTLDVSVYPTNWDVAWASLARDGTSVSTGCSGAGANPDPCIASRTRLPNGDVEIVVRTSHASDWAVFVEGPLADAGGPYHVAEGSSVTLTGSASGGTAPYSFLWDPLSELDDLTVASPSFSGVDDGVFPLRLTVTDTLGIFGGDEGQMTVTNVAPTFGPVSLPTFVTLGNTSSLTAAFSDAGVADSHEVSVDWGDGTVELATVTEENGAGTATASHTYGTRGSRTVTVTVTDDDGGEAEATRPVVVIAANPCAGPAPPGAIVRGSRNDTINGTQGDDVIFDAGGNNTINGRGGNDLICAGSGNDRIDGGAGNDVVVDAGGNNTINGADGHDYISTGSGTDVVTGGAGNDAIIDTGGDNTVDSGGGDDTIRTGSGNDRIDGGAGNDTIDGGNGNNEVKGSAGDDDVTTGAGNDVVDGGPGFDTCRPGGGTNSVTNCEG